jgi:hypothetical protein
LVSQKNNIRFLLATLFVGVVVLNVGLSYVAFELSGDSRPERLDELGAKIERGEVEVSKERFLASISSMKRYAIASDQLVSVFQKLVALLAVANILVVLIVVIWLWRIAGKPKPIDETDR